MKIRNVVLSSVLVTTSVAQINLSSLFSEAQSIYTVVTSALAGPPTSTTSISSSTTSRSSSPTTTSSSTSESSSSSSTSASSASAASAPTTSAPAQSSAASSASAAAATTSTGNGGGGSSNTLPIVLGCTLGALALAAFIALFFFCRRRSKRSKAAAKRRDLATSDDESDIWNREEHHRNSFKGPTERTRALGTRNNTAAAPLMSQHGPGNRHAMYESNTNQTAYGPAPPTRRFVSPDDHPQENEMTSYTAHPYSPDHVQSYGRNSDIPADNHHTRDTLAAGVGGAALGGLAAHAADRHEVRRSDSRNRKFNGVNGTYTEDEQNILPEATIGSAHRSSGSVSRASVKEPWPFMDAHERRSNDSARSRPRSFSRGRDQSGIHEQEPHGRHSRPSGAAIAGNTAAGSLAGTAAAHAAESHSPHRKGILKQTSKPASTSIIPDSNNAIKPTHTHESGPHELESFEVPPPVRTGRERRYSPLGTAAPIGAIGANRSPTRSHRKSWSNSSTPTNVRPPSMLHDSSQDSDIPVVPSRSPRRNSLHSNARYSTVNEGTVELPGPEDGQVGATSRELVSPSLEPHRASMDNDAVVSPISPDTSLPGTWSKAQAEELGMNTAGLAAKSSSQESAAAGYSPLNSNSTASTSSTEHSSGLVSAIQRIFNSQKQSWPVEESPTTAAPRRSFGDRTMPVSENIYDNNHRVASVPHRKPAPATIAQHRGQYNEINSSDAKSTAMPGGWTNETTPLHQTDSRKSVESSRSIPANGERFYARADSIDEDKNSTIAAVPTTSPGAIQGMNTGRARSTSRPGYGIGSGDPFDLARIRTDSNMTGISLANYTEPTRSAVGDSNKNTNMTNTVTTPQSHAYRASKPSQEYREPTLAELRREVQEEDRQRRMSWKSNGRRSNTSRKSMEGQRYGNDGELFDLAFPGSQQYDHFYGQEQQHTGSGVGTAY